jgi:acyl transferase domain-containing protein
VGGQAEVIAMAQAIAGVDPATITFIETHGTGTEIGDPIEIAALTRVFRASTQKKGFCAIGSVKTNLGHLDAAAGVAGLIKTALAFKHRQIPPSLHFERPNPRIDFADSPFYVQTTLAEWKANGAPLRAGVSSFGIGGTNAHVVLEESPPIAPSGESRPWQVVALSAKNDLALETATRNLATYLQRHPGLNLADVTYTLHVGRKDFEHRRILVCQSITYAASALEELDPSRVFTAKQKAARAVVFMFPGQGAQYVNMGLELYQVESVFREQMDLCAELFQPHLGLDLRDVLYPDAGQAEESAQQLKQTWLTQPALFSIEYALAKLLMAWGVQPKAMIGHSIGEYVAACLAGVFSLEDAVAVVATRGRIMQDLPGGDMLAVPLSEKEVQPLLDEGLSLAAVNQPSGCVVSGPTDAVERLEHRLEEMQLQYRRLHTSHAFHSQMMEPILEAFARRMSKVQLQSPHIPYLSNLSGTWITGAEVTDPGYWARHLRHTVRFSDGVRELLKNTNWTLLEVGPGRTLSTLVRRHSGGTSGLSVLSSLHHPREQCSDVSFLLTTLGKLWLTGCKIEWSKFYSNERRCRVPLPTYPFEQKKFWVEPPKAKEEAMLDVATARRSLVELLDEFEYETLDGKGKTGSTTLERVIGQQLEIISQQLDVLQENT